MELDVHAYLERIAFPGRPEVDLATLAALQRAHLGAVPFENLHVFHRRPVSVDPAWSVAKVLAGRGGWCFELNGSFACLLRALGFTVDVVAATVLMDDTPPPEPDHLSLVVHLAGRRWLVDVGFGVSVTRPLPLDDPTLQPEDHGRYRVVEVRPEVYALQFTDSEGDDGDATTQFEFPTTPRRHGDFAAISHHLATHPGLHWTQRPFAHRLIPGGRVSLLEDKLRVRRDGVLTVTEFDPAAFPELLQRWFGMEP